jgi:hypothetical protein
MSRRFGTFVVLVLVALPLVVLAVASTQRETFPPVTAAMHHHYFEVGKRECQAAIKKAEAQTPPGQQLLGFRVAAGVGSYPKEFRHDVGAGCQAASP